MMATPAMMGRAVAAAVASLLLNLHPSTLSGQGVPHQFREVHLGLEVAITAHGPQPLVERAVAAAFARIATLEQVLSDWRPTSELNRVTSEAVGIWRPISLDLQAVLSRALEVAAASGGAFDPTVGALTRLWREERRTGTAPDPAALGAARRSVDWRGVELDTASHALRLATVGTLLDLGGIAKGWILDEARLVLAHHGVTEVLLEAGGDIVVGNAPQGTPGWRIAIRTAGGDSVIVVQRVAIATSGPSAQSIVDRHGQRRSHVIDPATGLGLNNRVELTVIGADGATADAVATALTVMPEAKWADLLEAFGVRMVAYTKLETGN